MTPEQFCYWLQGFVELCPDQQPSPAQWQAIKDHLSTVFVKVTPKLAGGVPPVTPAIPPSAPVIPSYPKWPDNIWPTPRPSPFGVPEITCRAQDVVAIC